MTHDKPKSASEIAEEIVKEMFEDLEHEDSCFVIAQAESKIAQAIEQDRAEREQVAVVGDEDDNFNNCDLAKMAWEEIEKNKGALFFKSTNNEIGWKHSIAKHFYEEGFLAARRKYITKCTFELPEGFEIVEAALQSTPHITRESLEKVRECLEWERRRCGSLHGPLREALDILSAHTKEGDKNDPSKET